MFQTPAVSVVICTLNRAAYLEKSLASLTLQTLAPSRFEVIVVDNGSTDCTAEVVRGFQQSSIRPRYIYEPQPGLSRARNVGLAAATAPLVAYLDDDARAAPSWLAALLEAFDQPVAPGAVGGPVHLDWPGAPPAWLPQNYWSLYTYLDLGFTSHLITGNEYLVGANMAFRTATLRRFGGFDEQLGRRGTSLRSGEETAIIHRLQEQAIPVYYAANAAVWHAVAAERLQKRWLWKRVYWDGASQLRIDGSARRYPVSSLRRLLYNTRIAVGFGARALIYAVLGDGPRSCSYLLTAIQYVGRAGSHAGMLVQQIRNHSQVFYAHLLHRP